MRSIIAAVFLVIALVSGAVYLGLQAEVLTLAISADDNTDKAIFETAAAALRDKRRPVRLDVEVKANNEEVATALASGAVDLGVVRGDYAAPGGTEAVLILRREAAVVVAPGWSGITDFTELADKRIAIVQHGGPSGQALNILLDYYGLATARARETILAPDKLDQALAAQQFDVYVLVGPVNAGPLAGSVRRIAAASNGKINFINIDEAEAIAGRLPDAEAIRVPEGTFGGRPSLPPKPLSTVGAPVRLLARPDLDDQPVTELVRQLLSMRSVLRRAAPGAAGLETPDPDTSQVLVHAGTRAFRDGEQETFLDRYGDYLYLGLFLVGGLGSLATAVVGRFQRQHRQTFMRILRELTLVLDTLPKRPTTTQLDEVEIRIAEIYRLAVDRAAECNLSSDDIAAFSLALNHAQMRVNLLRARAAPSSASVPMPTRPELVERRPELVALARERR